jgi:hypothetical protein
VVQSFTPPRETDSRVQEVCSELQVALRQRKQINHPDIRRMLTCHIRDLKAELIVLGRL